MTIDNWISLLAAMTPMRGIADVKIIFYTTKKKINIFKSGVVWTGSSFNFFNNYFRKVWSVYIIIINKKVTLYVYF